jgi:hypothetical protein
VVGNGIEQQGDVAKQIVKTTSGSTVNFLRLSNPVGHWKLYVANKLKKRTSELIRYCLLAIRSLLWVVIDLIKSRDFKTVPWHSVNESI